MWFCALYCTSVFGWAYRVLVRGSIDFSVNSIAVSSYTYLPSVLPQLVSSVNFSILLSLPLTPLFRSLPPIGHYCHSWLVSFSSFSYTDFFPQYGTVSMCNLVPTFRLNIIALSSRAQMSNQHGTWIFRQLKMRKLICLETSGFDCPLAQRNIPEECITLSRNFGIRLPIGTT